MSEEELEEKAAAESGKGVAQPLHASGHSLAAAAPNGDSRRSIAGARAPSFENGCAFQSSDSKLRSGKVSVDSMLDSKLVLLLQCVSYQSANRCFPNCFLKRRLLHGLQVTCKLPPQPCRRRSPQLHGAEAVS